MIIKGHRLHKKNFAEKLQYIDSDRGRSEKGVSFELYQNVREASLDGALEAFKANDAYRKKIKNGVVMYHDMLSFSKLDSQKMNVEMLRDMTERYIALRAEGAVVYAKPHVSNENLHVHVLISGTQYRSSKTLRLDNQKFMGVRKQMEYYQREYYPELTDSLVYTKDKERVIDKGMEQQEHIPPMRQQERDKNSRAVKAYELHKRVKGNKISDKERMKILLKASYEVSESRADFYDRLQNQGIELYRRGKKQEIQGISLNNRHYRFGTLGVSKEMLEVLEQRRGVETSPKEQSRDDLQEVESRLLNKYGRQGRDKQDIEPKNKDTSLFLKEKSRDDEVAERLRQLYSLRSKERKDKDRDRDKGMDLER